MYVYYLYPLIPKKFNTICERYLVKSDERHFNITYNKEWRKIFQHNLQQRVAKKNLVKSDERYMIKIRRHILRENVARYMMRYMMRYMIKTWWRYFDKLMIKTWWRYMMKMLRKTWWRCVKECCKIYGDVDGETFSW